LFVAVAHAQNYNIAVVSEELPANDSIVKKFLEEIEGMDGYTSEHLPFGELTTVTLTDWDAAIVTENGTSGTMAVFHSNGWVIPVVHLKAYAIDDDPNSILNSGTNWVTGNQTMDLLPGVTDLVVIDNEDILSCWEVDDIVTWTEGYNTGTGAGEAHVQGFVLSAADNPSLDVAASAVLLAESPVQPALTIPQFMWKVEANAFTKRIVAWGIHHEFLEHATEDFWMIIKNSLMWVLDNEANINCGVSGYKDLTSANFKVYPNPVVNKLNIISAGLINSVNLIDITGKTTMKIQDVNEQHLQIDMSNLSKGLYVIHLATVEGETFTGKVSK